ncbi:FhaA domain-containing protein, partial [Paractinoplanes toevensis]|uniref:FhaA domain-containing protein n=1 Tax=Paractinoplanes toevensis TaxID=571911 RepID=UPI001BB3C908
HRDVKPANLLVRPNGTLVLTDFGIARSALVGPETAAKSVIGVPAYMSPEQVSGNVITAASDIYALGVVAYQCLSGHLPFDGATPIEIAMKHVRETPRPLPADIPPSVRAIVDRALAKDPGARWPSASAMAAVARQAAAALSPGQPPSGPDHEFYDPVASARPVGAVPAAVSPAYVAPERLGVQDIEHEVERMYPPPPRRLFRRSLTAVTVFREMIRTAEQMTSAEQRSSAAPPNRLVVSLAPSDHQRFLSWYPSVQYTFPDLLRQVFTQRGWYTPAVRVEFVADSRYKTPQFHVFAEITA